LLFWNRLFALNIETKQEGEKCCSDAWREEEEGLLFTNE